MDGDASMAGASSQSDRKEGDEPLSAESVPKEPIPFPARCRSAVRPSRGRRIVQILPALQYVVRRRRMPTYMGGRPTKRSSKRPPLAVPARTPHRG